MRPKKAAESATELSQLILPQHANFLGTVYGGTILSLADQAAYVCAARHAGANCVTVAVDRVEFHEPIRIGEMVTARAELRRVGRTSLEVGIGIFAENLQTGRRRQTNTCVFTLVHLGKNGRPKPVPRIAGRSGKGS